MKKVLLLSPLLAFWNLANIQRKMVRNFDLEITADSRWVWGHYGLPGKIGLNRPYASHKILKLIFVTN